ncbi:MAG: hypothetical protein AB3N16_06280 [Flavobacteriaceae bacterium]
MKWFVCLLVCLMTMGSVKAQVERDKALHFLGGNLYGLAGAGIASKLSDGNRTWTFVGSVGGSLLIGLGKEAIDNRQYDGWDNDDLLATVLGGATVGLTIDLFSQKAKRKKERYREEMLSKVQVTGYTSPSKQLVPLPLTLMGFSNGTLSGTNTPFGTFER